VPPHRRCWERYGRDRGGNHAHRDLRAAWENYGDLIAKFSFGTYLWNTVFVTVVATALTLLVNSMAYRFRGREPMFMVMLRR